MNMNIFKYEITKFPLEPGTLFKVTLPRVFKIRKMAKQGNSLVIWAEVYSELDDVQRSFMLYPTGAEIDKEIYIDSFFDGPFVWHLYLLQD